MIASKTEIIIPLGIYTKLNGSLNIPSGADSLVIFSHGSGSSRFSPRNQFVASVLNKEGIATLLMDLLTEDEDQIFENRFDISLLTDRLAEATILIQQRPELKNFSTGYFGASTGAASALKAASRLGHRIKAVVSRGGRPDLAENSLHLVKAPTLLIVGSHDAEVIELNRKAFDLLKCDKKMEIIQGATHLFEEAGKLEEVAALAIRWFKKYLKTKPVIIEY